MPDALITAKQTFAGEPMANVFGFANVLEDETWLQEFADDFRLAWESALQSDHVTAWSLDSLEVAFIQGDEISYSVEVAFTQGPLFGTDVADQTANQTALLVSTSYLGPRPNRGRTYFGGFGENTLNDGVWETALVNDAENLIQNFTNGLGPSGQQAFMRIFRRPSNVFPTYTSNPVSLITGRRRPVTQRRRRLSPG